MTDKPILFNTEMVRAILNGHKTQTRRVIKPQPVDMYHEWEPGIIYDCHIADPRCCDFDFNYCPYGRPGNTLWVRETWAHEDEWEKPAYRADWNTPDHAIKTMRSRWRPSIYMSRSISRITLMVTGVRVERVQDITPNDAWREGAAQCSVNMSPGGQVKWFANLWDSINSKRGYGWDKNPFVWVVEFEKI